LSEQILVTAPSASRVSLMAEPPIKVGADNLGDVASADDLLNDNDTLKDFILGLLVPGRLVTLGPTI
jgi:hypothetical protein